jgi:hypothetical protein
MRIVIGNIALLHRFYYLDTPGRTENLHTVPPHTWNNEASHTLEMRAILRQGSPMVRIFVVTKKAERIAVRC